LIRNTPVLDLGWLQLMGVVAAGLALGAQLLIRRSEGTLAGSRLARWAWWMSVLVLVAYWSYFGATRFVVLSQADSFVQTWFDELKKEEINAAFLNTQPPAIRLSVNPADEEAIRVRFNRPMRQADQTLKGAWDKFREHELVRFILQGGSETRVKALGVSEWGYDFGAGYKVRRAYQVKTPAGVYEVHLRAQGSESPTREYPGRRWALFWGETAIARRDLSDLGNAVAEWRKKSSTYKLEEWCRKLGAGQMEAAYLDTCDAPERDRILKLYALRMALMTLAAGAQTGTPAVTIARWASVNPDFIPHFYRSEYAGQFERRGMLVTDRAGFDDPATHIPVLNAIKDLFGSGPGRSRVAGSRVEPLSLHRTWTVNGDRLDLPHDCKFIFRDLDKNASYGADVVVTLESDPGPIDAKRSANWRVIKLELIRGEDLERTAKLLKELSQPKTATDRMAPEL
jgi:hypothetical protein